MFENELISIVTPMYNGEKYIAQTIESVLRQTYSNWEMIIVDDGSKDKGVDIVTDYVAKEPRIHLIRQRNGGSASARNAGLNAVKGRYVCFLDADDLWDITFLENQLKFIVEKKAGIVYASYRRIDAGGKEILRPFIVPDKVNYDGLLKTCSISCLTALFDKEKTGDVFFNETLKSMRDDFVFWLDLLKKVEYAYGNQDVMASYRVFASSTTGNKRKVMKPQFLVYYKVEKLSLVRSIYYFIHWAINGFFKYK